MPDLPRPVEVLHEGTWRSGALEALNHRGGRWRGMVRYSAEPGSTYLHWRDQDEIRPAT
jgi:hypothetical protein